eukprot:TRINITY_DN55447_c0_g1_i1.p1 TRINITY_DN55447_c0_g1~~TRINITY_DN55447_c0_g1_i1.p1  ORF type:complete len:483 (+),score=93.42 TRINITY_DN55447_c0_g1_i1:130-1578(+)
MATAAADSPTSTMFDPEVVTELRRQFDSADVDGNGTLDAHEACLTFAKHMSPNEEPERLKRTADTLRNQMDADRSGTISFDEYCFRFGRKYQMELARKRRLGMNNSGSGDGVAGAATVETGTDVPFRAAKADDELQRQREALEREREALRREREDLQKERECGGGTTGGPTPSLSVGSRVTLGGLRGAAELNGRIATVLRFDSVSGRFVVDLEGGGGQKSLRPENLTPIASTTARDGVSGNAGGGVNDGSRASSGSGFAQGALEHVKAGFGKALAHFQIWLAGYEWWQLLLGAAVVLLFVLTWFQVSNRYTGGRSARGGSYSEPRFGSGDDMRNYGDDKWSERGRSFDDGFEGNGAYADLNHNDNFHRDHGFDNPRSEFHGRSAGARGYRERYSDEGYNRGSGHGGGGGGGLLGGMGQTGTLLVVAGIGYACWTGIIPVHRMSWFQLYMLWNMIQPLLFGGRSRRGYGGFGGFGGYGRRGFF